MAEPQISPRKRWFPEFVTIEEAKEHWRKGGIKRILTREAQRAFKRAELWTYTEGGLPAVVAEAGGYAWAIAFERSPEGEVVAVDAFARRR